MPKLVKLDMNKIMTVSGLIFGLIMKSAAIILSFIMVCFLVSVGACAFLMGALFNYTLSAFNQGREYAQDFDLMTVKDTFRINVID